jgi:hypothetical protein
VRLAQQVFRDQPELKEQQGKPDFKARRVRKAQMELKV